MKSKIDQLNYVFVLAHQDIKIELYPNPPNHMQRYSLYS